jgi:hypothetical protein
VHDWRHQEGRIAPYLIRNDRHDILVLWVWYWPIREAFLANCVLLDGAGEHTGMEAEIRNKSCWWLGNLPLLNQVPKLSK